MIVNLIVIAIVIEIFTVKLIEIFIVKLITIFKSTKHSFIGACWHAGCVFQIFVNRKE